MKYIIICLISLVVCFGVGFLISKLIWKTKEKWVRILSTIVIGFIVIICVTFLYMGIYYHASDRAVEALDGSEYVKVNVLDYGYFFDGNGTDTALIFYPGAKVECEAYASLMLDLADRGIDCFLIDMPLNFSIFGSDYADKVLDTYKYDQVIMAGHSLGGLIASGYANENSDKINGLVLLASYSTEKIDDGIKVLSIYGTEDLCLNCDSYEQDKVNWPNAVKEVIIDGGNHAQFGDYGAQKGDGSPLISAVSQKQITIDAILEFFLM